MKFDSFWTIYSHFIFLFRFTNVDKIFFKWLKSLIYVFKKLLKIHYYFIDILNSYFYEIEHLNTRNNDFCYFFFSKMSIRNVYVGILSINYYILLNAMQFSKYLD